MRVCTVVIIAALMAALQGCASNGGGGVDPRMTQLAIREFQTRSYETRDEVLVLKALLNALQDEFYIIKSADADLGLITAAKELDVDDRGFFSRLFSDEDDRWKKNSIIECSGNVSPHGAQTRVRLNFQMKTFDNRGAVMEILQIQDPAFYQDFFSRVDKSVFLAKEKI